VEPLLTGIGLVVAVIDDVSLQPYDWLDTTLDGFTIELDRPVENPVVGYGDRVHTLFGATLEQRHYLASAIQHRELTMQMKVDKTRRRRRCRLCAKRIGI
jgi:hypothetical protein